MYDICIYEELTNLDRLIVLTISLLLIIFIGSVNKKKNKSFLKDTKTGRLKMIERKAEKKTFTEGKAVANRKAFLVIENKRARSNAEKDVGSKRCLSEDESSNLPT